jgi:hypothetical protein
VEGLNLAQVLSVLEISKGVPPVELWTPPSAHSSSLAEITVAGKCTLGTSVASMVWFNGRRAPPA